MNFNDFAIVSVERNDYRIQLWYMSKDDAINIMKKSDWKKVACYNCFSLYLKMSETIYYKRNRETMFSRANDYCENNKEN